MVFGLPSCTLVSESEMMTLLLGLNLAMELRTAPFPGGPTARASVTAASPGAFQTCSTEVAAPKPDFKKPVTLRMCSFFSASFYIYVMPLLLCLLFCIFF